MRAVITVIGQDMVGIIADVSSALAQANANILDITQSVLQDFFAMVMLVDISGINIDFEELRERLSSVGDKKGLKILCMHEDIFNSMHRI